jgi:hypothetical protein
MPMHIICRLAFLTIGLFAPQLASAQSNGVIPTDNELLAGYCFGVTTAQLSFLQTISTPTPGTMMSASDIDQSITIAKRNRQRFLDYLLSTNSFGSTSLAIANGKQDWNDLSSHDQDLIEESQIRIKRCNSETSLPF